LGDEINLAEPFPLIYSYDESRTSSGWVSWANPVNLLHPMKGFAVNFGSTAAPVLIDISGEVNNGPVTALLYNHNNTYTQGFNLVGNPYPSPIDWNAASGWTKTNIDNANFTILKPALPMNGRELTELILMAFPAIRCCKRPYNPSMQGFFIHVSADLFPVTGILGMTNSVRFNDLIHPHLNRGKRSLSASQTEGRILR
jgi:hypothetical protein